MRKLIIIFTFFPVLVYSQSLEKLEKERERIAKQIIVMQDSLKKIDLAIHNIKSVEILSQSKDSSIIAFALLNAKLKKNPTVMSEIILEIPFKRKVVVLDYDQNFFGVCVDSICGYMNELWLVPTKQTDDLKKLKIQQKNELKKLAISQVKTDEEKNEKLQNAIILKKYGPTIFNKLKQNYYWIGMNKEMAIISLGEPNNINRTVGVWGVHEQWVYKNFNLYFENGKLTSYQD
jgi:hypothetical protein